MSLISYCIKQGVQVLAVCHEGSKRINDIPDSELVTVVECDLQKIKLLPEKVKEREYDTFFHFAWDGTFGDTRNNMELQINNILYTIQAVHVAKEMGCKRFIGAGSQAEYGRSDESLTAHTPVFPENGYGMAKLCAGQMSRKLCETLNMEHIWTRVLSVYGPYDNSRTMIMSLITGLLKGETIALTKGEQVWDYLYAKDAGRAFYEIGSHGVPGTCYPLGYGTSRPLAEYVEAVVNQMQAKGRVELGAVPYSPQQVMHLAADISELTADTGFVPEYSFEEGIQETIQWVIKREEVSYEEN